MRLFRYWSDLQRSYTFSHRFFKVVEFYRFLEREKIPVIFWDDGENRTSDLTVHNVVKGHQSIDNLIKISQKLFIP